MKKSCLLFLLIASMSVYAQVPTRFLNTGDITSRGYFETPAITSTVDVAIDVTMAIEKDEREIELGLTLPFRFGKGAEVNYNLQNSGEWFEKGNGKVWKLKIRSKNAFSINLIIKKLSLPEKAELIIYNEERTMAFGPVTSENVPPSGRLMTDLLEGESITLELFVPESSKGKSILQISRVVHAYKDLFIPNAFGDSNPCNIDINCSQGNNWQSQSDGVALILLGNGEEFCSGVLLNNGCQDFVPNILSAFHCVDVGNDINNIDPCNDTEFGNGTLTQQEIDNAEDWMFRFQYKSPACNGGGPGPGSYYTFQEATFRAGWFDTDFALLEMLQRPTGDINTDIKHVGWDRRDIALTSGATIHHPVGDVMKISIINNPAQSNNQPIEWALCRTPRRVNFSPTDTHWNVNINQGTTERGSSGSPIFNQNKRVVGQLHGGFDGCAPVIKYYGRFDVSWGIDDNGDFLHGRNAGNSLGPWLTNDPAIETTGILEIPHFDESDDFVVCNASTTYQLLSFPSLTHDVSWSVTPNLTLVSQFANQVTVRYSGTQKGEGAVTATLSRRNTGDLCPVTADFTKTVQAGPFASGQISVSGTAAVCPDTEYWYEAHVFGGHQPGYIYTWTYPSNWLWPLQTGNKLRIKTPINNPQYGAVRVSVNNGCGASAYSGITVYPSYGCGYFYSYYPNPVNEELTVVAMSATSAKAEALNPETIVIEFDIKLYDADKNIVRTGKSKDNKVIVNTKELKKGFYFLHITDKEHVVKEQIIVE